MTQEESALVERWDECKALLLRAGFVLKSDSARRLELLPLMDAEITRLSAQVEEGQKDAERYRGVRALKYKMYAADARSLGPQMKWESEETFNATYDRRADEAIDTAMVKK